MPESVLEFWFDQLEPSQWWKVDHDLDQQLRERFLPLLRAAAAGELAAWRGDSRGRLAEILLLDQFSRNIFRNTPRAFSQDALALVLSQEAIAANALKHLSQEERNFLLMPWMHSESAKIHQQAEILFRDYASEHSYEFELKHKVIIDRFGRYPHRNAILGRESTPEEVEFLKQPGSSF
ncbi:DUF924 family protein [Marinospirillum perlucidum]|uniref:DUF924 family protein n=1 Tax=Marinospirillum perlucidum TaxID=1982602 RepID=UPI000DF27061|nr:DUF924 family protein [Marinospirillum perlucidum]